MHMHDLPLDRAHEINISHDIKHLSFGEQFPGIVNPLDESKKVFAEGGGVFQYYVKIVRTTYEYLGGQKTVSSNQYAIFCCSHFLPLPSSLTPLNFCNRPIRLHLTQHLLVFNTLPLYSDML